MISPETRAQIRRYFYAEHWKGPVRKNGDRAWGELDQVAARRARSRFKYTPQVPRIRQIVRDEANPRVGDRSA